MLALDCVLWGASGHAKVLTSLIHLLGGRVSATLDINPDTPPILGARAYYGSDALSLWLDETADPHRYTGVICIGGGRGADRLYAVEKFRATGLCLNSLIHPQAFVDKTASIGEGSHILAGAVVGAQACIGSGCIVNHNASIDHESTVADGVHIAPGATVCGLVQIDTSAFIGAGAVILPRLRIGAHAVVGAGAVVTRSVAAHAVVAGNPAKPISK